MTTLALIPARAGSKSIPGKNTRDFCGRPLLAWAVEVGRTTCDQTVVTTDGDDIARIARRYLAGTINRPAELATDEAPMLAVVQHALSVLSVAFRPDVVVLLQPTQPLRTAQHVIDAVARLEDTGADSVVSVVQIPAHYSPDYAVRVEDGRTIPFAAPAPCLTTSNYNPAYDEELGAAWRARSMDFMVTRRQDVRPAYSRDGTVYAIRRQTIETGSLYGAHCVPLVIPAHESVNLDSEDDWKRAETMVS